VFNGLLDPGLTFYSDEVWFTLSEYVNRQNNGYWSTENAHAVHEVPKHDDKVGVRCSVCPRRRIGLIFLRNIKFQTLSKINNDTLFLAS
jgi:hypothetical protein